MKEKRMFMKTPHEMDTLSEVMNTLKSKGFAEDFSYTGKEMYCKGTNENFKPEDLIIKRVYRFEGMSDPEDMSVLYAIEAASGTKGLFVDAFGTYGSYDGQELVEFMKKVKIEEERT